MGWLSVILEGDELAQVTTTSPCGAALWKVGEICWMYLNPYVQFAIQSQNFCSQYIWSNDFCSNAKNEQSGHIEALTSCRMLDKNPSNENQRAPGVWSLIWGISARESVRKQPNNPPNWQVWKGRTINGNASRLDIWSKIPVMLSGV